MKLKTVLEMLKDFYIGKSYELFNPYSDESIGFHKVVEVLSVSNEYDQSLFSLIFGNGKKLDLKSDNYVSNEVDEILIKYCNYKKDDYGILIYNRDINNLKKNKEVFDLDCTDDIMIWLNDVK